MCGFHLGHVGATKTDTITWHHMTSYDGTPPSYDGTPHHMFFLPSYDVFFAII